MSEHGQGTPEKREEGCTLRAEKVSLSFPGKTVLDSVSLEFRPGEFSGIIGPNGSGKTSLLRVLDGIYKPDSGSVLVGDRNLSSFRPKERARKISFMMQGDAGVVTFSSLDVVLSGRYPYGKSAFDDDPADIELSRGALERVGLPGFEDRRFDTLSTGEQQLVLFARILAQDTPVVLLDEPTSNLDITHQERIFSLAGELAKEGKTVVASIHAVNEASRRCERIVLLDRGRVAADGSPQTVMTPGVMDGPFSVETVAVVDPVSGSKEIRVRPCRKPVKNAPRVHLVGGGGSALGPTRALYEEGFTLSGSPVPGSDPDAVLWSALGIPFTMTSPFSAPDHDALDAEAAFIREADAVLVCLPDPGSLLLSVLELASVSKRLFLLRDGTVSAAFFRGGDAAFTTVGDTGSFIGFVLR